jgi:hypothetical protein
MMAENAQRRNYSTFSRNLFNVRPGQAAFEIATNLCDQFELGARAGEDYWLEANLVDGKDFVFNGRLFLPDHETEAGTIIDNFPKSPAPMGWTKRPRADGDGYELVSPDDTVIFGYRIVDNICHVTVNIYAADGDIVAESTGDELRIYRPPMTIGRGGAVWK